MNNIVFFSFAATASESIFIRPVFPNDLYKLRDDIKFHLYINTAPCGDARIFSPHEDDICVDKHPNRFVMDKWAHLSFEQYNLCNLIAGKRAVNCEPKSNRAKAPFRLKAVKAFKHGTELYR